MSDNFSNLDFTVDGDYEAALIHVPSEYSVSVTDSGVIFDPATGTVQFAPIDGKVIRISKN